MLSLSVQRPSSCAQLICLLLLSLALISPFAAVAQPVELAFADIDLATVAGQVPLGGELHLEGFEPIPLKGKVVPPVTLELERFQVFDPAARVVVHGKDGDSVVSLPDHAYFRGRIAGEPRSLAFLTVAADGAARGLVNRGGEYWVMESPTASSLKASGLRSRPIDAATEFAAETSAWSCGADVLQAPDPALAFAKQGLLTSLSTVPIPVPGKAVDHTARVAIETDWEFFQKFGNVEAAVDYVGDLMGFVSSLYEADLETSLLVSHLSLWSTSADPWGQSNPSCGLYEFGAYWNANHADTERTIAHFMSGKSNGGGVAWVGVLCQGSFGLTIGSSCPGLPSSGAYGGAYGYSGDLDGNFDLLNPSVVWDVVVVSHEIGHNFNSPHSHCYAGLGGNAAPIDQCYSGQCGQNGCNCDGASLPCGIPGAGCGTIMSYCHLLSGGLGNIAMSFGRGHPYGVDPERVPDRMRDHVEFRAAINPSCLSFTAPEMIFSDGFESGSVGAWSASAP